jgi:hypothetical protein
VARGVLGIGLFVVAISGSATTAWAPIVLLPLAFVALRGCPMCWTMGLIETIAARFGSLSVKDACVDGQCALSSRSNDTGGPGALPHRKETSP